MDAEQTRILFLAAEAAPLIKVGGLGDVAGSLPPALRQLTAEEAGGKKLDVRVAIPLHGDILSRIPGPEPVADFLVQSPGGAIQAQAFLTYVDDMPVYLISGPPIPPDGPVYSLNNEADGRKFVFFSLAALEFVRHINWQPHIIHANDWHTALSAYVLSKNCGQDPFFQHTRSVLSIHNLPFMGDGAAKAVIEFGIPPAQTRRLPSWARSFPLPLGLLAANKIVAVSPTYAEEIMTPEFGCGLQQFLSSRRNDVSGILNGIDIKSWDPTTDVSLGLTFDCENLYRRRENKFALQEEVGFKVREDIPVLIMIGRMDPQKGVDIAIDGLRAAADIPWQVIILGTGVPMLESAARSLETEFPEQVRAMIKFDPHLARRMYAGGDILLMPSRYEPCGLAQMIAMRYGCVPLARATGGLKDTIVDAATNQGGTGFLFEEANPEAFTVALKRTLKSFSQPEAWAAIQCNGMLQDFSWHRSAIQYAHLYRSLEEGGKE